MCTRFKNPSAVARYDDTSGSNLEILNLVLRPDGAFDITATASKRNYCRDRTKKRKTTALGMLYTETL
ncbi:hypothetical protein AYI70_g5588 [Smittium culicis]|uniref:Uncharacterized protein n=1 Tax=Smittium culicis TaxID=133412 RepID=A0A1R1XTX8_9FUNG|nr:hypothetical protein AYI70_g5588 [Smittium culicis]